jgi:hypothetical protein
VPTLSDPEQCSTLRGVRSSSSTVCVRRQRSAQSVPPCLLQQLLLLCLPQGHPPYKNGVFFFHILYSSLMRRSSISSG